MKNQWIFLLLVGLVSVPALAGTETHGGHVVISEDGKVWLRDLVDKTSCRWQTGSTFSKTVVGFPEIHSKIRSAHSFLAELIDEEITKVRVCLTSERLRPVPEADQDVFLPYRISGRQIATRVSLDDDNKVIVFIDTNYYSQLSAEQRPYLWMHELAHGLIPFSSSLRSIRLRSLIASLYEMRGQQQYTKEDLQLLMDASLIARGGIEQKLENAARSGNLTEVKEAIRLGADPKATAAFYFSVVNGHLDIVKILAAYNTSDSLGWSDQSTSDLAKYCENKNLEDDSDIDDYNVIKLPLAYRYLISLGCHRPKNLKAIAEILLKNSNIDWSNPVDPWQVAEMSILTILNKFSAPDLANLLLERKKITSVIDRERLVSTIWNWIYVRGNKSQRINAEMSVRQSEYLRLFNRLGGDPRSYNGKPKK